MTKPVVGSEYYDLQKRAKEAEWYETPVWAAERILDYEIMPDRVLDPCAGRGVLGNALIAKGYYPRNIAEIDLNRWPGQPGRVCAPIDFLSQTIRDELFPITAGWAGHDFGVMMNPPFSKTCEFVQQCFDLGARKIIMFQRFNFLESATRAEFFQELPPARIWLCGDRAHSWRGDMPEEDMIDEKGELVKGKKGRSSPTAHCWMVWERGHRGNMAVHHLYRER
ncbi:MAG: hypothetical protein LPK02_07315 [Rhodobacterales bacterium]|nr:hypothetical protein [Rhodobacterales bacterium]